MSDTTPVVEPPAGEPTEPAQAGVGSLGDTLRTLVVAACVGGAVIHFTYAPEHFQESSLHGAVFLAIAWAQVGLAFALARWREARWPWQAAVAVNAAVVALWTVSRTVGVPGSDRESVGFPDTLATVLEVIAVAGALVALRPALARRPSARLASPVLGGAVALAMIGAVSASVTPQVAGEHDHADGQGDTAAHDMGAMEGMDHGHGQMAAATAVDTGDRCDLGFNTQAFNDAAEPGVPHAHEDTGGVDFTIREWADVFVDPAMGFQPAAVAGYIETQPLLRDGILSGALTHTLAPDPWNPMTDPDECQKLADELEQARAVAQRYPTIAEAEAAGYRKVTTYYPGIAAHYINYEYLRDGFVLDKPEMLLYDGDGPTASIVGLSYYIVKEGEEEPTDGFTGNNDHYHKHVGLCIRNGVVAAGSNASEEQCGAIGGRKADGSAGWMSHVWIVPGCESDWGVFSGANPSLKVRGLDTTGAQPTGCGTGKALADDLAFGDPGEGPEV
ncbi:MAG TPA: hypothetical protein VFI47_30595 [Acidimicrobiales bacterium]|nr:hypothetical protein [Acidimicrobiales bacterium]